MFTPEQRNRVRERILELARSDARLVSGGLIGSNVTGGDRWSDLDLTFGLAEGVKMEDVLRDWTSKLAREFDAAHLFDLPSGSTMYRVFLLPGNLQVDLSFTPQMDFGAIGPKFNLLYGRAVEKRWPAPPPAHHFFGYAVHHLVRARICVERGRHAGRVLGQRCAR